MAKFHLTENGPRPCTASKKPCPLGGEHFDSIDVAEQAYANLHGGAIASIRKSDRKLPNTTVQTIVLPQAGGRYFGCHVSSTSVGPYLEAWRDEVGVNKAEEMEALKAQRDRGYVYHLTVVTPPEMKQAAGGLTPFPEAVNISYSGVGSALDGDNEAWFVVCESSELKAWREENNLPPKDLHITIGFSPKDVHNKSKGTDSLKIV